MTAHHSTHHQLIVQHRPLAARLVRLVLARVPAHVDRHDLAAAGDAALARAAASYDVTWDLRFASYAGTEIKRSLRDLLRSLPLPAPEPVEAEVAQRLQVLKAAFDALPEELRAAVTSYFEQGRPADRETLALISAALRVLRDSFEEADGSSSSARRRPHRKVVRRTKSARFEYLPRRRGGVPDHFCN
jgi:DNA-directed RNA polymerase specialized sigma subunit